MPVARDPVDVVVVGSGFGGSVTANRLALAGKRVLVLERGPWRDSLPVRSMGVQRRAPFPYGSKALSHALRAVHRGRLQLRLNSAGLFELFLFPGVCAVVGSAVGGGSTAYGGLLERPRNAALWHGRHPELDPGSVERYYDKVVADMGGVLLTRQHVLPQSVWTHFPDTLGRRCSAAERQPHMALLIPPSPADAGRTIDWRGVQRQYCAFDGDSFLGSRGGAKASVDFVYLAPVLDKGVTVRDLCQVTRVRRARPVDGGGYLVQFTDLANGVESVARAGSVVLAAGTMNTLQLLFASASPQDGLAPMPALGQGFSTNGDLVAVWHRASAAVSSFTSTPSHGSFTIRGYEAATFGMGGLPGFQTLPLPAFVKRKLEKRFFMYGIGVDSGNGSVRCEAGRLRVEYDQRNEPIFEEVRAAFRTLETETGDQCWVPRRPITVHPGGGARVSADDNHGVVDHRGQVHRNPGLFVADGSVLPAAVGGPPALAIAAWAHHVADGIAEAV